MSVRKDISFEFLFHGKRRKVWWPWQDYIALAYVLNNPAEAYQLNKGPFQIKFKEKCSIKLDSKSKDDFDKAEEKVRDELSFQIKLRYKSLSRAKYPFLLENIHNSYTYKNKKIFGEEHEGYLYIAFDRSVSDELDSIVILSDVSCSLGSGEDGGQSGAGVNTGRTSPGAQSAGTDGKHSWKLGSKCTVTLVQKAAGKTDADVVLDIFETGRRDTDFKLDRKGGVLKVQFPLPNHNFPSANSDLGIMFATLLKEEKPRKVALDIDKLKTWSTKHFIQNALKSILAYAKEDKTASLKFEMILCNQDIASFEQTAADIDKHIGEWTWFESLESGEDVTKTDLMIEIKSGSLEKTKADALVCTMRGDLELNKAGASAAMLRAAGSILQTELRLNYMYPKKLDYGEIAVVSGHNLDCSYVLLGVMNAYDDYYDVKNEGPEKFYEVTVHDFMVRCLEKADELGLSSLAFPAVGCGSLRYPVDIVAEEMFSSVTEYRKDHPKSRINHVVFVIYHRDEEALQVFKEKETKFCQTRRRADVYDVDAGQDQPKQQPKSKASPAPNRKNDDGSTCEKTSRQPTDQDEVNQLSDDLKKHKLEDSEENGLYKSKRSKMAQRQFSAHSEPEDDEDASAYPYRLWLPRNVSNGVAEFFNSKLLHEYSKKGLKFKFGKGYLEYGGSENLRDSFEKKFEAKRDNISSELQTDSMPISSNDVGNDVFNKEFEAEGVYLEYDLETQTMTFYGMKWDDIQKVKLLYMSKFKDFTIKRGDRHLDSANSSVSSGKQSRHTGSDGGARQKTSGATKHTASKATAFSWLEKTSDLVVFDINKVTVKVYCADILDVPVDCIVNAANTHLNHRGGVAKFIAKAAGQKFVKECDDYIIRRGPLKVGEACFTSAGDLPYFHVIHTVGPSWSFYKPYDLVSVQKCETDLDMAIRNSLSCAEKLGLTSVAIPAVSAGKFGCPVELCVVQYAKAVLTYVDISRNPVQEIHFVDKNTTMIKEIQKVFNVASKKGCIPQSYNPQNFVIPQTSSAHAENKGSKGVGKTHTQPEAANDSRWSTTYGDSYSPVYPFCMPDKALPTEGQIFTCLFSPTQKLLVYHGNILLLQDNIDMIACTENTNGTGTGFISKQLSLYGNTSYRKEKERAFKNVMRGDVIVCKAGDKRFRYVAHAILFLVKDCRDEEDRRIKVNSSFTKLLEAAVDRGCKSLTLPLLGTGKGSADPVYYTKRLVDSLHAFSSSALNKGKTLHVHLVNVEQDKTRTAIQTIQAEITDMKAKSQAHRPPPARPPSAAHNMRRATSAKRGRGGHHAAHTPRSNVGGHKPEAGGYPKSGHKYSMRKSDESGSDDESSFPNSFLNKNTGIETDFDNNRDMARERDDKSRGKFSNSVPNRTTDKETEFASNREMTRSTKETTAQKKGNLKLFDDDDEGDEQGDFKQSIREGVKKMSLSQRESKQGDTGRNMDESSGSEASETEDCVICMDTLDRPKTLRCGHKFCKDCIEAQFKYKQACPTCGAVCGVITGDQPEGRMDYQFSERDCCAGYERYGRIQISYSFPNGVQQSHHPTPGRAYKGIRRSGFLPDNKKGRQILAMLQVAFDRKLVFTIGNSVTTGQQGVITWNDIHHKTDPKPNTSYGYPDPTYLERVVEELKAKGVTEADIPKAGNFSRSTRM